MPEEHVTLYGDDASWFREAKQRIAEQRDGNQPGNAETVRLLLQHSDI